MAKKELKNYFEYCSKWSKWSLNANETIYLFPYAKR